MWCNDVRPAHIDVVAQHIPDGTGVAEPRDLVGRQAATPDHRATVVCPADPDKGDVRTRRGAQRVGDRLLFKEPIAHVRALDIGRRVEVVGPSAAAVGER